METETAKILEQINASLNQLAQMESEDNDAELRNAEDVRKARLRLQCCRSDSAFFDRGAQESRVPDSRRVYSMEAEHFREMARLEEEHIAPLVKLDDTRAELKHCRAELFADLLALHDKASTVSRIESN